MTRIGLATSGTTFSFGLHPKAARPRINAHTLMDKAQARGLVGIELPDRMIDNPEAVRQDATERGMFVTVDTGGYEPDALARVIELAGQVGSPVVRTVVGGAKIGGDRRPLAGRWQPFLDDVRAKLKVAAAEAERAGVTLCVENHQDLASEELLQLCEEIASPFFGINLDTGNPLATAEEPIDYFRRVAPHVKNVHLKDYWTWWSDEGFLLVRSPLGQGLVDFPVLLDLLAPAVPDVPMSIELGALEARNIRVFAPDFWPDYPPRTAAQLAEALRVVRANAKPDGDWRTPYERGESPEAIEAYEQRQLTESVEYVRGLVASR
ncbi:sugar phosphate isomerase/epimerase family protein [Tenggerimyces flavus]|uniref:Sugar phosphate isomerase/epimerase n=1 Tax=Tenggerimyces flavus TaxID=1708749 RepID=A0ABV7Y5J1_9ACTN|nr:sugar phosphate isomerase/epimerase [Tenggerimyces flavus]MBM7790979.1 sugar phosphate isomerase/epimerase [Tenggerimyces flavus]